MGGRDGEGILGERDHASDDVTTGNSERTHSIDAAVQLRAPPYTRNLAPCTLHPVPCALELKPEAKGRDAVVQLLRLLSP